VTDDPAVAVDVIIRSNLRRGEVKL
jgi:hypothetical protein